MHTAALLTIPSLKLPLALAQQLAGISYQQGQASKLDDYSQDLLAGMQVKSQLAASALNDQPQQGFHYQRALLHLRSSPPAKPLSLNDINQLHRQLNAAGGQLRQVKPRVPLRHIENELLQTATATSDIEATLVELLAAFNRLMMTGTEPLVAIPLLALDFMRVFPYLDGNRRVMLLLMRHLFNLYGHPVVCYVDLESEMQATEKAFYQSLHHCSQANTPPFRWMAYWWVVVKRVYQRFNHQLQQANITPGRGAKTALIEHFITQQKQPFLFSQIRTAFPTIGPDMIRVVLRRLRNKGLIKASGRGRGTRWEKLTDRPR